MNRIHQGLVQRGVDSHLLVRNVSSPEAGKQDEVHLLATGWGDLANRAKWRMANRIGELQKDPETFFSSINLFPNQLLSKIDQIKPDIVNLHWVGAEILRIEDLARIGPPVVWTLMDMWPFCGAEHYDFRSRWKQGYSPESRSSKATGFDVNRWVFKRKQKAWKSVQLTTVSPSVWIRDCVKSSSLWGNKAGCNHLVIPFGLDTSLFFPREKKACRTELALEGDGPLLLFGATSVTSRIKGMSWLLEALRILSKEHIRFRLAVFGRGEIPQDEFPDGVEVKHLGKISDPITMAKLYSAADLMLMPSRMESFGQTASEAQACGVPVVSFDTSGVKDIVVHQETGYRAECFNVNDFAHGIGWCLEDDNRRQHMGTLASERACRKFDFRNVAQQYHELYLRVLNQ